MKRKKYGRKKSRDLAELLECLTVNAEAVTVLVRSQPPPTRHRGIHRVGRVLSFFSSRRNWDSPNPSPAGESAHPPRFYGEVHAHSLAREGLGESQFRRGDIHLWYSLYIRTLWWNIPPLKVLTNEKRGGLRVISFDRSPFKLISRKFSKESVQA
jgi:hypothetical protein